jgi:hypothetical protein
MKIAYVTGSDSDLFANACMLFHSFAEHMPGQTLRICDFGMEERHRRFFEGLGVLIPRPPSLPAFDHPLYGKAAVLDYVEGDVDALVWLDTDMVVVRPFHGEVAALAAAMDEDIGAAICTDAGGLSIGALIEAAQRNEPAVGTGTDALEAANIDPSRPYLNTGFFVLSDKPLARAWRDLVWSRPVEPLFEQNAFNALAYGPGRSLRVLDPAVWNVHGDLLDRALRPGGDERLLHATSHGRHHTHQDFSLPLGDHLLRGQIKLFTRADLCALQKSHLLAFLTANRDRLIKSRVVIADATH